MKKTLLLLLLFIASTCVFAQKDITVIECSEVEKATTLLTEVSYKQAIEQILQNKIETCAQEKSSTTLVAADYNPFVFAVHTAFAQHRPLSLSPDMIWLLICQGFSEHVHYHSDSLQANLVAFTGKKKISLITENFGQDFTPENPTNPWELLFPAFKDSIRHYVGKDFADLVVSDFSTTTPTDKIAFQLTLMNMMSSYFDYEVMTFCGIPQIYLEGSLDDWEKLKANTQKLKGYGIDYWIDILNPILDEFIYAKRGIIHRSFWQSLYKLDAKSGGPYISGWMIKFFPYLNSKEGKPILNQYVEQEPIENSEWKTGLTTHDFFNGISQVDFVWQYLGKKINMAFVGGFIGVTQNKTDLTLRPEIGWAVKQQKK